MYFTGILWRTLALHPYPQLALGGQRYTPARRDRPPCLQEQLLSDLPLLRLFLSQRFIVLQKSPRGD